MKYTVCMSFEVKVDDDTIEMVMNDPHDALGIPKDIEGATVIVDDIFATTTSLTETQERAERFEARVQHVLQYDIPAWQNGSGDRHTARLIGLIAKSDVMNRERHRLGFPAEVEAYERWMNG